MSNRILSTMCLLTFFGLLVLIPIWQWLYPNGISSWIILVFWWLPLLLTAPGVARRKFTAMAWASFAVLIPLAHGVMLWFSAEPQLHWAAAETLLAITYIGAFYTLASRRKKALKALKAQSVSEHS